jgi:GT2 family glycosyltransferase
MLNVSIVTYQTPLKDVLNAVSTCYESQVVVHIYVIDNSPEDSLSEALIPEYKHKVKYTHNPSNPGYGAAHNIAINESLSHSIPFHLVLNADVIFDYRILDQIVSYANRYKNIGLIAPKMLYEDGSVQCSRKLLPTPINMFLRAFLPKPFRTRIDDRFQLECFGHDSPLFVPYVSGAFMFLRTSVLHKIGIFDERFFMYPEDIDLSRRVAQYADVSFVPDFIITHKYGGATRKSLRMFVIHAFNMCRYFNKWGWIFDKGRRDLNKRTLEQKSLPKLAENL